MEVLLTVRVDDHTTTLTGKQIVGQQSGRCIDIDNLSTTKVTQAELRCCNGGTNQRWTCTDSKQLMVYGNKCPDVSGKGSSSGTAAVIWDCNGRTNQQWNINTDGTITGVQSGLCLDAEGASTANGTKIQLWSCSAPRTSIRVSRVDSRFEAPDALAPTRCW
ncbi:ricin-type beta-trefoil lectin domain protein, partial [Streptomyces sp. NPDC056983]|uniref:RICIN domain-containing protein n=1 Tax=Streptomyces sp. NPDC056983 TaxID=3345987 RepID=UPI0036251852